MDKPLLDDMETQAAGADQKATEPGGVLRRRKGKRFAKKTSKRKGKISQESSADRAALRRSQRPFPASSFEEPLEFAKAIFSFGSGQPVRRLTLFDHLKKSPESGGSRQLLTNASKYGLIKGGYQADQLELTPDGAKAVDEGLPVREIARVRVKLAIEDIPPFRGLYERLIGNKLPAKPALVDSIQDLGVSRNFAEEAVDTFIVNLRFVGLLKTLSGAERIIPLDHLLDSLPASASGNATPHVQAPAAGGQVITQDQAHYERTCFYITPIGSDGSEQRKHSDLFLGSIIEPSLEPFGLTVVRADGIDKPGVITRQVVEYILRSRIVIADLSFHNPNVFYELALRHATRLPIVQIIRSSDLVPFDVHQMRTINIDTTDIYSLVPKIELYRSEIANQVRRALENSEAVDTPISVHFPALKMEIKT
jgi:hypothetical protein